MGVKGPENGLARRRLKRAGRAEMEDHVISPTASKRRSSRQAISQAPISAIGRCPMSLQADPD
jgi:hypothetical protein